MAGAGLIVIKRRIKSVTSTKKITKAMGLVATSKLRKTRTLLEVNEKYSSAFADIMTEVVNNSEGDSIYIKGNKAKKKLYVVLTSDSGLCGGFNASVVNASVGFMKEDKANSVVIVVGQKGRVQFRKMQFETAAEYVEIPDLPTMEEAKTIAAKVLEMYNNGEVGEVYMVYTKFHSIVKQSVELEKMLPLSVKKENVDNREFVKFEPDLDELIEGMTELHLRQSILNRMLNAKASEQGSRMSAMDGATSNADDILEKLNLQFNRMRQSVITQEISEIVGGAEAQK